MNCGELEDDDRRFIGHLSASLMSLRASSEGSFLKTSGKIYFKLESNL